MTTALHALLSGLIDYAGLFPPAKLDMDPAVRTYARCRLSPEAWMLSRFICPVARFDEFARVAAGLVPLDAPWQLSALLGTDLNSDLHAIENLERRLDGRITVPAVEFKADGIRAVDNALEIIPEDLESWCELPWNTDVRGLIAALSGTGIGAKLRTGGLDPSAFPPPEAMARFLVACRDADVPIKMTAGMHHPVRHESPDVRCKMHGFLNAFLGAIACRVLDLNLAQTTRILEIESPAAFSWSDSAVDFLDFRLTREQIADARSWARSFGSCSFDEPVADLRALRFLP